MFLLFDPTPLFLYDTITMLQSELFTRTQKEAPKDEVSTNAQLLIRAGFIHKEMAGVYTYLPLGLRVFKKIENIIREEMNAVGGQEMLMTTLQDPETWKKTDRWIEEGEDNPTGLPWFKTQLANGGELGIANTHEEALTKLLTQFVFSYNDLPLYAYQFQNKFRNEIRAKSGIMRTREFVMKDLYSFSKNEEEFKEFYEKVADAYVRIFKRVGVGEVTYRTFASGGAFSKFSDEFQTISSAGEDIIYICTDCKDIAVNEEIMEEQKTCPRCEKSNFKTEKSIEVGNIFPLGTKFTKSFDLTFSDENGGQQEIVMGSYGIGLGRLMGAIVEVSHDENGIVWPEAVSPFDYHVIIIDGKGTDTARKEGLALYEELRKKGHSVLCDDRKVSPGEKLKDADLIGITKRIVVSDKTLEEKRIELKLRDKAESTLIDKNELLQ